MTQVVMLHSKRPFFSSSMKAFTSYALTFYSQTYDLGEESDKVQS